MSDSFVDRFKRYKDLEFIYADGCGNNKCNRYYNVFSTC